MAHPTSAEVRPEVEEIAKLLGSNLAAWRKEASARLRQREDGVEILNAVLRPLHSDRTNHIIQSCSFVLSLTILQIILIHVDKWLAEGARFGKNFIALLMAAFVTSLIALLFAYYLYFPRTQRIRKYGTLLLAREYGDDIRAVGLLVEGLEIKDAETHNAVVAALTTLLPRLTEEDSGLLDAKQRTCLYRALSSADSAVYRTLDRAESMFLWSLLHAVEVVGDANAIPYVQRLAASYATDSRIASAIQQCLEVLRERAASANAVQTLLRPSEGDTQSSEILLRPVAANVTSTETQTLLRASSASESTE